jgi:hypothetical protein
MTLLELIQKNNPNANEVLYTGVLKRGERYAGRRMIGWLRNSDKTLCLVSYYGEPKGFCPVERLVKKSFKPLQAEDLSAFDDIPMCLR